MKRPCPVCDSDSSTLLVKRRFAKLSDALIDGYNVVSCDRCGFCFADDLPGQDEFDTYYQRQSKYEFDNRGHVPSEYDTRRFPFAAGIVSEWLPNRKARILDIGCANGGFLGELLKRGYLNLVGVDPSPACARNARESYGLEVVTAPISQIPSTMGKFDLVSFGSVLEHVVDLAGTIERTKKLLAPQGAIYVEVPDMTKCSLLNDAPFQEFSVEHINFYGPISLGNLFAGHGFGPIGLRQTEIEQVPGLTVYEIKAMFRSGGPAGSGRQFDFETRPELERYIALAQGKMSRVNQVIDSLVAKQTPIVIWGVGTHTQSLLATTNLKQAKIAAFVDSNTRYVGQSINDIPVLSTDALKSSPHEILVSSQQFQTEISNQIRNTLGLPNNIITLY
jgi:SAM-dependent methyltransferase